MSIDVPIPRIAPARGPPTSVPKIPPLLLVKPALSMPSAAPPAMYLPFAFM